MLPEQHIQQELLRSGRRFFSKKKDFVTSCPNPSCPSHSKNKLKLEIKKDGTKVHCWVCDWSGSWDKLAKEIGAQPLNSSVQGYSIQAINNDFIEQTYKSIEEEIKELKEKEGVLPKNLKPWASYTSQTWRGLTVEFLTSIQAQFWNQPVFEDNKFVKYVPRILLPFYQRNKLVGYTGRRLDQESDEKYYNAPWSKSRKILYPFDYVVKQKPKVVVLTEGQIDALVLIQHGIPALCILGTQNWSDLKRDILISTGINRVYLCMDGDKAGREAATDLLEGTDRTTSIINYFDYVEDIVLPDDIDPGKLQIDQLNWLKGYIGL